VPPFRRAIVPTPQRYRSANPGPIVGAIGASKQMFGAFKQIFDANQQIPHTGLSD